MMVMERRAAYQDEPAPELQERAHRLIYGNDPAKTYNTAIRILNWFRDTYPKRTFFLRYHEMPDCTFGVYQWLLIEPLTMEAIYVSSPA